MFLPASGLEQPTVGNHWEQWWPSSLMDGIGTWGFNSFQLRILILVLYVIHFFPQSFVLFFRNRPGTTTVYVPQTSPTLTVGVARTMTRPLKIRPCTLYRVRSPKHLNGVGYMANFFCFLIVHVFQNYQSGSTYWVSLSYLTAVVVA